MLQIIFFYLHITFCRFKLILGQLQLDNQLPLSTMPVVLATESKPDSNRPVFKANIAVSNVTSNGIQVYPHVYIRVMLLLFIFWQANLFNINPYWKSEVIFSLGNWWNMETKYSWTHYLGTSWLLQQSSFCQCQRQHNCHWSGSWDTNRVSS